MLAFNDDLPLRNLALHSLHCGTCNIDELDIVARPRQNLELLLVCKVRCPFEILRCTLSKEVHDDAQVELQVGMTLKCCLPLYCNALP